MYECSNKQPPSMAYGLRLWNSVNFEQKKLLLNAAGIDSRIRNTVLYGLCNSNQI